MSSFLNFIEEDIEAKKTLFSTMPVNTKSNIKKFNERIDDVSGKYSEYKIHVKKYLDTKSKSFNVKCVDNNLEELRKKVTNLEHVRFVLNPLNTYFEKMGFDNLLFQISNYYEFNFGSLNDIINQFLDKFELAGIKLFGYDFDYTCYVQEYMNSFLEVRNKNSENYDEVSKMFEKIYWVNPEIIGHIELNFRKLIKKYEKKFINYIKEHQKNIMLENKINAYEECLEKLKVAYTELNVVDKEGICDIINLAKAVGLDINNYFEDSKVRISTYTTLMVNAASLNDKAEMEKFYENLEKLKTNVEEYNNYIKFIPLIDDFKKEYEKQIPTGSKDPNRSNVTRDLKNIETQIATKEAKLEKLNKKILDKPWFFESKNSSNLKQLKIDSVNLAKELYDLYKTLDKEYFNDKVLSILNKSLTISDLLYLYYSFDYFKKNAIKKVFDITIYDEVIKYSESFDLFAMNPTNIIIEGIPLFEESNISKIIMNKYRLDNINLNEENLIPDDLKSLLDKIQLLLRVREIEKSETTVEKIWFMVQVEKINVAEKKKEQEQAQEQK